MNILSLDTSTRLLGVGVLGSNGESASGRFDDDGHSAPLFTRIDQLLSEAGLSGDNINLLAIVGGPGSFTGLRIGIAGLLGWAEASDIPLQPIDSFHAIRSSVPSDRFPVLIVIYSRAEEFYFQTANSPDNYSDPFIGGLDDAVERVESKIAVVGPGAERFMNLPGCGDSGKFRFSGDSLAECDMISVCREAKMMYDYNSKLADKRSVEPYYMTLSQAQINFGERERRL